MTMKLDLEQAHTVSRAEPLRHTLARFGLFVLLALGCATPEPIRKPVHLLDRELIGGRNGDELSHCMTASEFRPSIGCTRPRFLGNQQLPWPKDGLVTVEHEIEPIFRRRPLLIHGKLSSTKMGGAIASSPIRSSVGQESISLSMEAGELESNPTIRVAFLGYPIHAVPDRRTNALPIPKDAILTVGLGIRDEARMAKLEPIRFLLSATHPDSTEETLLDEILPPEALRAGWNDRRIDLAAFAGKEISFHFRTERVGANESEPPFDGMLPLWGAPLVLAPVLEDTRPNLLLISLDTLRADMLGARLAGRAVMPFLESLMAESTTFTSALTTYPSTTASHMSLLTGLYPRVHGLTYPLDNIPESIPTLADFLATTGWVTAATTENGMIAAKNGFARGFEFYRENRDNRDVWVLDSQIEQTFAEAGDWITAHRNERFFFFLHTYEVHYPAQAPAAFDLFRKLKRSEIASPIPESEFEALAAYAAEARFTDAQVEKLFARLADAGLLERTIVVITSDHGEGFGEDGVFGHSGPLAEVVFRVPLLFWGPGRIPAGHQVDVPVSLVDITPTFLELLELEAPAISNGTSFLGFIDGRGIPEFPTTRYGEVNPRDNKKSLVVARQQGRKWMIDPSGSEAMKTWDLVAAPHIEETLDDSELRAQGRDAWLAFEREVAETRAQFGLEVDEIPTPSFGKLDGEVARRLKLLGYLE